MKIKALCSVLVVGVLMAATVSLAGNRAVWIEGEVTRTPVMVVSDRIIEVDGVSYRILPDIRITRRYLRNKGAYNEDNASVNSISTGQKIMMKIRKKDVIKIILF